MDENGGYPLINNHFYRENQENPLGLGLSYFQSFRQTTVVYDSLWLVFGDHSGFSTDLGNVAG